MRCHYRHVLQALPSVSQSFLQLPQQNGNQERFFSWMWLLLWILHITCAIVTHLSPSLYTISLQDTTTHSAYAILAIIFISGDLPFCLCVHPSHWTEASVESTRVVRDACLDKHNHHHHWSAPNRIRMRERLGDTFNRLLCHPLTSAVFAPPIFAYTFRPGKPPWRPRKATTLEINPLFRERGWKCNWKYPSIINHSSSLQRVGILFSSHTGT